jgi:hypothetical protein
VSRRLDDFLRWIVAALPWYDSDVVEARHARTERVRLHSIDARRKAEQDVLEDWRRFDGAFRTPAAKR